MSHEWDDDDRPERIQRDGKRLGRQARSLLKQTRRPSFHCVHCGSEVPTEASHTKHRNHCPICLWSRHVDESIGDRKSTCLSSMEPLGLTIKRDGGEIMIVHRCAGCGKIGKNRTAADDNAVSIMTLLDKSVELDESAQANLEQENIELCHDRELVERCIWGHRGAR